MPHSQKAPRISFRQQEATDTDKRRQATAEKSKIPPSDKTRLVADALYALLIAISNFYPGDSANALLCLRRYKNGKFIQRKALDGLLLDLAKTARNQQNNPSVNVAWRKMKRSLGSCGNQVPDLPSSESQQSESNSQQQVVDFETRFIESIMEIISLTKPVEGLSAISAEARVRQTPSLAPIPHSSNTDIQNWGAIIPQRTTNLFFRQLSEELLRLAGGANPRVILYGLSDRDSSDTVTDALDLCKTFKSLNCSGIFFVPFEYDSKSLQNNDTIVDEIERNMRGTELVLLDRGLRRYPDTSNFDVVRLDNLVAGQKLLDGLRERILHRCRKRKPRIVFIHRPNSADSAELRLLGINAALERHGLESIRRGAQNGSRVVVGNPSDQGFLESQNLEEADAVICPNDVTAQVVNEFLEKLPVSKRPLLAGFDGVVSPAKWYSVPQPTAQIAMVAWTIMRMRMLRPNENYKGSVTVLVQPGPVREPAK